MCDSLKVVRALDCNVKEQSGPNIVVSIHVSFSFNSVWLRPSAPLDQTLS